MKTPYSKTTKALIPHDIGLSRIWGEFGSRTKLGINPRMNGGKNCRTFQDK